MSNRGSASGWLETIVSRPHGSCLTSAALTTLQIAKKARTRGRNKHMFVLYNEPPQCGGRTNSDTAIEAITGANKERLKISVDYIPEYSANAAATNFGRSLAAANHGKFTLHAPAL